jgi:hypothetical protein
MPRPPVNLPLAPMPRPAAAAAAVTSPPVVLTAPQPAAATKPQTAVIPPVVLTAKAPAAKLPETPIHVVARHDELKLRARLASEAEEPPVTKGKTPAAAAAAKDQPAAAAAAKDQPAAAAAKVKPPAKVAITSRLTPVAAAKPAQPSPAPGLEYGFVIFCGGFYSQCYIF